MTVQRLLIANRGEVAIRVMRAALELGIEPVAVFSEDDDQSLHVSRSQEAVALRGTGPAAYLDVDQLVAAAATASCQALHPGYGFVSESAVLARACAAAGIVFAGPAPETLDILGDKTRARALALEAGTPVVPGSDGPVSDGEALAFLESLGPGAAVMVKAVAGGGGRGMRAARDAGELPAALARCRSEAAASFGDGAVFVEQLLGPVRHVEVQIAGDDHGQVMALGERDCSIQRRNQKIVEVAPAPGLGAELRHELTEAALRLAKALAYRSLGTFEFLVDPAGAGHWFIEANPRLQVEHTVTEEVLGLDLVQLQLRLAAGESLAGCGLDPADPPRPRGYAIQARVNTETMDPDGGIRPTGGELAGLELPAGPGIRVDSAAAAGSTTNPRYDSLLAKVIAHDRGGSFEGAAARLARALGETVIVGFETNVGFLRAVLASDRFRRAELSTGLVDAELPTLLAAAGAEAVTPTAAASALVASGPVASGPDPDPGLDGGAVAVVAPLQGTLVTVDVVVGATVAADQQVAVMEAMKMEHVVVAGEPGTVVDVRVSPGETVPAGHVLATVVPGEVVATGPVAYDSDVDLDAVRADLAEVIERHEVGLDPARPEAVARRRKTRQRTARENVAHLVDEGTFVEYGALVLAAQRRRRPIEELIAKTPADGLVAGVGQVNGELFGARDAQCVVMSYDYTVLAGTQGSQNHRKKDRMFQIAEQSLMPLVLFSEGGGGRPGDTDGLGVAGLDCLAFQYFGRLSGLVPLVGINSGRCFAGNAALLGCCDVIIATEGSNIGMGGPAMIEGGGLGVFTPEQVGPMSVQVPNGVVDIAVADEAEAVEVAKRYLSYFQGDLDRWECADQRLLRRAIPENRLRVYDVRSVLSTLADTGSVLELRSQFGVGMVTALARFEGRPVGVVANNPTHLAGAIDADGADKAARFMQLCDAFGLPIVFLCDTPGIMVGPEVEKSALVRHAARMFVTGANLSVPICTVVLRKGYGLGAQAMAGGSFHAPSFIVGWPTSEFGGMGLEGAVKLGYRNELAAIDDPAEREATFDQMVDRMYQVGKGVNMASHFEIDDVIDPLDTRRWIMTMLDTAATGWRRDRGARPRPAVDTW